MRINVLKMSNIIFKTIFFCIFFIIVNTYSQEKKLTGRIVDENQNPLNDAEILLYGTTLGSYTNSDGYFIIENIPVGNYTIIISMIGYVTYKINIKIDQIGEYNIGDITLTSSPISGETVVVTASKYKQDLQDVPVSISLVSKREINSRNSITLNQALQYVPGVNMNSTQINIRGSSGYSRGVGSRVLFLIDGIPFLTGDTREISYDVLPSYLVDRVEVLKGAGSALYGSSALGGVVNFITSDIRQSPPYYAKLYGGTYSKTAYEEWNWSNKRRYFQGAIFSISRDLNKVGFQLGGAFDRDDSYRESDSRDRYSGSGKFQWMISPNKQLSLAGNYMAQNRRNFLYWHSLKYALQPPADQLDDRVESRRYFITTDYRHILGSNTYFIVRGIWFHNHFKDNVSLDGGNNSISKNLNGEIQFTTQIEKFIITSGIESTGNWVESNIFGENSARGFAAYFQGEYSPNTALNFTAGARFDYFDIDSVDSYHQLNPKAGVVYHPFRGTSIRTSFGMGFRAPSLAEVFTSTYASGFQVIPNLNLKPEKSKYFEIGWNQFISDRFVSDISYFHSRYEDLIEGELLESSEVQFQNITQARVQGTEMTVTGQLIPNKFTLVMGYTYIDPEDLDKQIYLSFRPRHLFHGNTEINISKFNLGVDYRYIKKYDQIDEKFKLIIKDADQRVDAHIVDFRLTFPLKIIDEPIKISLVIDNIFNYYHTDLVGSLAPVRRFTLFLETS